MVKKPKPPAKLILFVEKVDKVAELTYRFELVRVFAVRETASIDDTKSCCELRIFAVTVLAKSELVYMLKVEMVLGSVTNPPPVVTPIMDDAYNTSVLTTSVVTVLA